jgi:hypothetical protein
MSRAVPARVRPDHIRKAIAEDLRDLHLAFEQRVFANRVRPFWADGLPGCSIFTLNVEKTIQQGAPRQYKRAMELVVELSLSAKPLADGAADRDRISEGTDDPLDVLADQVELYFEHDQTLGGLVDDVQHKRHVYDPPRQGEERFAYLRLLLEVSYYTDAGELPDGGLDPLRTVRSDLRVNGGDGQGLIDTATLAPG